MKQFIETIVVLLGLVIFFSSAQAAINIEVAEVQNAFAFVKGNDAARGAQITWDGNAVTTANKNNGGFSFNGSVPADCIGVLSDGVSTINVQVLNCTPVSAAAPAPVPKTGQTTSFATGDDGALKKGVAWPTPRFTDNSNGTITDKLTGLIWLKNANCPGTVRTWQTALNDVASLNSAGTMNSNNCGDTSNGGSHQTDWRLPNIRELHSLVDFAFFNPAISNAAGTGQGTSSDPFSSFQASGYWSSTTSAGAASTSAWGVGFLFGDVFGSGKSGTGFVLAVRGGS